MNDTLRGLQSAVKDLSRILRRAPVEPATAEQKPDDVFAPLVDEVLWALHEESTLKMLDIQRRNPAAIECLLIHPPNEREREVLATFVELVRDLCREQYEAVDAVGQSPENPT